MQGRRDSSWDSISIEIFFFAISELVLWLYDFF